jgi:hypothetical protein
MTQSLNKGEGKGLGSEGVNPVRKDGALTSPSLPAAGRNKE